MSSFDLQLFGGSGQALKKQKQGFKPSPDLAHFNRTKKEEGIQKAATLANPKYREEGHGNKYTSNCQRCIFAYELRRRGYDVEARSYKDDGFNSRKTYTSIVTNNRVEHPMLNRATKVKAYIENQLKGWGDGSRAAVMVSWKGGRYGHAFIAENVKGTIRYIDPQSGNHNVSHYLETGKIKPYYTGLLRLDNAKFSSKIDIAVKNSK